MANKQHESGTALEKIVAAEFARYSIGCIKYKTWIAKDINKSLIDVSLENVLVKNYPYINVAGDRGKSEYVWVFGDYKTRIECRNQMVSGTVQDKLFYHLENARFAYTDDRFLLVCDGSGAKPSIVDYVRDQLAAIKHIDAALLSLEEFRHLLKKELV